MNDALILIVYNSIFSSEGPMSSVIWKFSVFFLSITKGLLHIFGVSVGVQLISHLPFVRMTNTALIFLMCIGYFASIYWTQIRQTDFLQRWTVRGVLCPEIPFVSVVFLFTIACLAWSRNLFLLVLYALLLWSILLYSRALLKQNRGKQESLSEPSSE